MKSGKAADDKGIVAELLCKRNDLMMQMIADIFTAILDPAGAVPDYWRASSIRVLFKKGEDQLPENYRPICIIPILYKRFSRVVCGRVRTQ